MLVVPPCRCRVANDSAYESQMIHVSREIAVFVPNAREERGGVPAGRHRALEEHALLSETL